MPAFTREGAPSSNAASSNSENMRNNVSPRSCPGMIPPPLEMFPSPRKQSLDGLFRFAGELCHLPSAPVLLITPEQDEAIRLRQTGQDALRLHLQQCLIHLFLIHRSDGRFRRGFVIRIRPFGCTQTLAVVVVNLMTGHPHKPTPQARISTEVVK